MSKSVLLLGAGGHALVLFDLLQRLNIEIEVVIAPINKSDSAILSSIKRLELDEQVLDYNPDEIVLVNGIGSMPGSSIRESVFKKFKKQGYSFMSVISPSADVSSMAKLDEGAQVFSGAVIQAGSRVLENTIVNTGSSIDHDCEIGMHCHIAPGATLSGSVVLEGSVHVGTGASIIQGVTVGSNSIVGAGACLTKNVASFQTVLPAKVFIRENSK